MNCSYLLVVSSLVMLSMPALAQEAEDDIVVTAQRTNQSQVANGGDLGVLGTVAGRDAPFAIRSYNEAVIVNQQPQTLGALLENDPSVRLSYGFGNAAELFVIRGFPLFGDDVGLNGLYGIAPRQIVAPELSSQVQLLNGTSAFVNGAAPGGSGIGGSVNLILKRPATDPVMRATIQYTSNANVGGSFDISRRSGNWGFRLNGALRGGDVAVSNEDRRAAVAGLGIDFDGGPFRAMLDLAYQRVEIRRLRPKVTLATTTIPNVPAANANYAQPWAYTRLHDVFGVLRLEYDLMADGMVYLTAGARDGSEYGVYQGLTVTDATTGAAIGNALFVPRSDNNEAITGGLRWSGRTGAISHKANVGGAVSWQVNRNAYDFLYGPGFTGFTTNLYAPSPVAIPSSTLQGGNLADPYPIGRSRLASVFASDTLGFADDHVLLTLGARWQRITTIGYSYFDGTEQTRYARHAVTPIIGLVVKATPTLSLYANRAEALQQGPTAPNDPTLSNPGEVFAPFKSVQYEAGVKFAFGRLEASAAVFQISQPTAFASPVAGSALLSFVFGGEQRNRGIELSLNGELAPGLRLISGLSVTNALQRRTAGGINDGRQGPGVPSYTANADLEWDLPFARGLTVTGRIVDTGRQYANADNTLRLGGWTRFDLGARYVFAFDRMPITLRAGVDNVANRRYWASAFDSFSTALLQGKPRTFRLSVTFGQ